jgi:hypothetical protein
VTDVSDDGTQITATSPVSAAGTVNVTVTTAGGTSVASSADEYTYDPVPTNTGVDPNHGPHGGGTTVAVAGRPVHPRLVMCP